MHLANAPLFYDSPIVRISQVLKSNPYPVAEHGFDDPVASNVVCASSAHHVLAIDATTCFNSDDYVRAITGYWWSVSPLDDEDW